jgi:hypothetical protein
VVSLRGLGLLSSLSLKVVDLTCTDAPLVGNLICAVAFRSDRCTNTQAGPMAVTMGLPGELGCVGIDAVLVPTPPRRFGSDVREPVDIQPKLARSSEHRAPAS